MEGFIKTFSVSDIFSVKAAIIDFVIIVIIGSFIHF